MHTSNRNYDRTLYASEKNDIDIALAGEALISQGLSMYSCDTPGCRPINVLLLILQSFDPGRGRTFFRVRKSCPIPLVRPAHVTPT